MNDVFARIGVALAHLVANSTVHGPQKEEVLRLSEELQTFDSGITEIVNARVAAAVEGIEGRIFAQMGQPAANEPEPEPAVVVEPVAEPEPEPETLVAEAGPESVAGAAGEGSISAETESSVVGDAGNDSVSGGGALDHDDDGKPGGSKPAEPTDNPDEMTIAQATAWLDENKIDHAGVTLRDDLRGLVKMAMEQAKAEAGADTANSAANTTIMVEGGASDVVD